MNSDIDATKLKLKPVANPMDLMGGSVDIDLELFTLAHNLKVLVKLKCLAGFEAVKLEKHYNQRTLEVAKELAVDQLQELGVVKSDKFKYIRTLLFEEYADLENMRIQYKYFNDMWSTYCEWVNVYKKTRSFE